MAPETHTSHHAAAEDSFVTQCVACHKSVAAPKTIIGQLVECPFCQHQFIIEAPGAAPATPARDPAVVQAELISLEGQLKENATQVTELRGHVSRLNMELYRHQLRMQSLSERQTELQTGITDAKAELGTVE